MTPQPPMPGLPGGNGGRPLTVGAGDLAASSAARAQRETIEQRLLGQFGAVCPCGERVHDEGVRAAIFDRISQPGAISLTVVTFHSTECEEFKRAKGQVTVFQDCPTFHWAELAEAARDAAAAERDTDAP